MVVIGERSFKVSSFNYLSIPNWERVVLLGGFGSRSTNIVLTGEAMGHNYKDLIAWKKAKEYAIYVYEFTWPYLLFRTSPRGRVDLQRANSDIFLGCLVGRC
jgi:hypothetical protein